MRRCVHLAGREIVLQDRSGGLSALLASANAVLANLPGRVLEEQRAACVQAIAEAPVLGVMVLYRPKAAVRIIGGQSGGEVLAEIALPAPRRPPRRTNGPAADVTPETMGVAAAE
jgi:hypothetical protein